MRTVQETNTKKENKDLWSTPLEIISYFNSLARKPIALDAAASDFNAVLDNFISEEENTLVTPWQTRLNKKDGSVWLNPPFSCITPFVDATLQNVIAGCETTLLVTNSTCAKWFSKAASMATTIFLPEGRISFISAETGLPVGRNDRGSAIFHFDPEQLGRRLLVRPAVKDMMNTPVPASLLDRKRHGK